MQKVARMTVSALCLLMASCVFLGAGFAAALGDIRSRIISNRWVLALVAAAPLLVIGGHMPPRAFAGSLALSAVLLLLGAMLFARGWIGGGDVKLICAMVLWFPPADALWFVYLALVFGGVLALLVLFLRTLARRGVVPVDTDQRQMLDAALCVPYAVSIATAGALVFAFERF